MSDITNGEQGDVINPPPQEAPKPFDDAAGPQTTRELLRQSRAELVVSPTGPEPENMAQMIDYAGVMAKAVASIPVNLRGNIGDCLAIVDIAKRAGLSPFMMAGMTYVEPKSGKLCFMSQLYNALNQPWMDGTLMHDYIGEGPDMICVVTGTLKGERRTLEHRSEPLKIAHPGFTLKRGDTSKYLSFVEGWAMILEARAKNETIAGLNCKGSPLWLKKPRVQLFYDTSRDWIRTYNPRAVLGIYSPEEINEYDIGDEGVRAPVMRQRLGTSRAQTGEGFRNDHVATELSKIAADVPLNQLDLEDAIRAKDAEIADLKGKAAAAPKKRASAAVKAAADRAEARSKAAKSKKS